MQPTQAANEGVNVNRPLRADELHQAELTRALHANNGHPSDQVLSKALDSNAYSGCDLTSRDVANAKRAFGDCEACTVSKMTDPPSARASRPPAGIGSHVYAAIAAFADVTLGGNKFYKMAVWRNRHIDLAGSLPDSAWGFVPNSVPRSIHSRNAITAPTHVDPADGYDDTPDLTEDYDLADDDDEGDTAPNAPPLRQPAIQQLPNNNYADIAQALPARVTYQREHIEEAASPHPSPAAQRVSMPLTSPNYSHASQTLSPEAYHTPAKSPVPITRVDTTATPSKALATPSLATPQHITLDTPSETYPTTPHSVIADELRRESVTPAQPTFVPPPVEAEEPRVVKKRVPVPANPTDRVTRARNYGAITKGFSVLGRLWVNVVKIFQTIVGHITLKAALAGPHRKPSETAILKELHNILEVHDSIEAIAWHDLTQERRGKARRNFMFIVHKYLADGAFDKVKARWVYGAANSGTILDEPHYYPRPALHGCSARHGDGSPRRPGSFPQVRYGIGRAAALRIRRTRAHWLHSRAPPAIHPHDFLQRISLLQAEEIYLWH